MYHRFFWFLLYLCDMRNLDKEKKLRWMMDPRSGRRAEFIKTIKKVNLKPSFKKNEDIDPLTEPFSDDGRFKMCNLCGKKYTLIGPLMKHLVKNHGLEEEVAGYKCTKCQKPFKTKK